MDYDAIIFDNDGILTKPTPISCLRRAIRAAFSEFGVASPTDEQVESLIEVTVDRLIQVCTDANIHDIDGLWHNREIHAIRTQREVIERGDKPLYNDVDLADFAVPVGVVSNNQHETVTHIIDHFDLREHVQTVYGRPPTLAGIRRKKPRPYYLRRAISDLDAKNPLYVGDSRVDIQAANSAGVDIAFIRRPHRKQYQLDQHPTYEFAGLEPLPELTG